MRACVARLKRCKQLERACFHVFTLLSVVPVCVLYLQLLQPRKAAFGGRSRAQQGLRMAQPSTHLWFLVLVALVAHVAGQDGESSWRQQATLCHLPAFDWWAEASSWLESPNVPTNALNFMHASFFRTGCAPGQPMYAGDWAREGVRISLVKTGTDASCSRYVTLEMVDEDRYARNPYAESLAVIVNFPPGPALVVPYESGKLVYNITLQLPQLPCDASPSCVDYIGDICQQQGFGFYYQLRMTQESGDWTGQEYSRVLSRSTFGVWLSAACCDSRLHQQALTWAEP